MVSVVPSAVRNTGRGGVAIPPGHRGPVAIRPRTTVPEHGRPSTAADANENTEAPPYNVLEAGRNQ